MGVSFLTPVAALFGVLAAVPLAVFAGRRRRAAQVRSALRLEPLPRRPWGLLAACLAAVPILVGVAAAQPVVTSARTVPQRSDAEVFIVLDTSRSMLASSSSGEPSRFERARDDALALQAELPGSPGRNRVAHRPRSPAPLPDGRSARVRRDDARGRRHRAATAVDLVRYQRDDARRARRRCRR